MAHGVKSGVDVVTTGYNDSLFLLQSDKDWHHIVNINLMWLWNMHLTSWNNVCLIMLTVI